MNNKIMVKSHNGKRKPSKGQRLGWTHQSDYEPLSLRSLSASGEKLSTYTSGPFAVNKLVP